MLFPDPSTTHQCQIIHYNILREADKGITKYENKDIGKKFLLTLDHDTTLIKEKINDAFLKSWVVKVEAANVPHYYNLSIIMYLNM